MRTSITLVKEQQGLVSIKREKRRNISPYKTRWYDMKIALIGTKQEQSVIVSVTRRRVLVHVWTIPRYTYWARIETTGNMIPLSLCVCVCVCVCVRVCVRARVCYNTIVVYTIHRRKLCTCMLIVKENVWVFCSIFDQQNFSVERCAFLYCNTLD